MVSTDKHGFLLMSSEDSSAHKELYERCVQSIIFGVIACFLLKFLFPQTNVYSFFIGIIIVRFAQHTLAVKQKFIEPLEKIEIKQYPTTIGAIVVGGFIFMMSSYEPGTTVRYFIFSIAFVVIMVWLLKKELEALYTQRQKKLGQ